MRRRYASSMRELAVEHWDKSHATMDSEVRSRVQWIRNNVLHYFLHRDNVENVNVEEDASFSIDDSGLFVAVCKDSRRVLFRDGLLKKDPASGRPSLSSSESEKVAVEGRRRWMRCVFDQFSRFPEFESVAVDISPSTDTV